jgi:hypothetical protein
MNSLTTSKVVGYLAIIFVAGGATGAVLTLNNSGERRPQVPSMQKACNRLQDRLTSKLGLTPDQLKRLQPLFDHTANELRAVHSKALGDTEDILRRAHEEIAKELTPEQKLKLDQCDHERHEWLRQQIKGPNLSPPR